MDPYIFWKDGKFCNHCGNTKNPQEFSIKKTPSGGDTLATYCTPCVRERSKIRRKQLKQHNEANK